MPFIILILGALAAAIYWWARRNPQDAIYVAQDAITAVRNAPRRLAFRRQTNAHPVEGIEDPRIAICAICQAFIELDDLPTVEQRKRLNVLLRSRLRCQEDEATEMEVLGRWLVAQCQGADAAISRLGRKLHRMEGEASWPRLHDLLADLGGTDPSEAQVAAIDDLRAAFRQR